MNSRKKSPRKQSFLQKTKKRLRIAGARLWEFTTTTARRLLILTVIVLLVAGLGLWFTLPSITDLKHTPETPGILIVAEDESVLGSYGEVHGDWLKYEELPKHLVQAVLATEDRNFFSHFGIDPIGLARATFVNMRKGKVVQGGSTITQQLAKNLFLTPERTFSRKIREMLLAFKLEAHYSKQDILANYLNSVYLGAGSYGIDAAAKRYFDKSARELTLAESSVMAGLLKAPSRFAPTSNPQLARSRAEVVLESMADANFISQASLKTGKENLTQLLGKRTRDAQSTLYFTDWVVEQLPEYIANVTEDIVVRTTLQPEMQKIAEKALTEALAKAGEKLHVAQGALVTMTPDGAVRAMLGGKSYGESQFNRATQSKRQPGSAFKLFVYLTALEGGLTPTSMVEDAPITVGKWTPQNYTGDYRGVIPLKEALMHSINTVAVQLCEAYGRGNVINMAQRLGITSEMEPLPSIALGATEVTLLELTGAYAHLAANGEQVIPHGILEIKTKAGRTLYRYQPSVADQLLSSNVVGMANDMLSGVITGGTGTAANIRRAAAGKTGTTSDYRDAWFIGYTPDMITGVWVGNDDNTPMRKVTGGMIPAQIWREFMANALVKVPARPLPVSSGSWLENLLPWQSPSSVAPPTPAHPVSARTAERPEQGEEISEPVDELPAHGEELGQDFWDKVYEEGGAGQ